MEALELFENEQLITESDSKKLVLTSARIRYDDGKNLTSIMLDKISSLHVSHKEYGWLLVAGIIGFAAGLVGHQRPDIMYGGIGIGIFLAIIYWATRKHVVTITSDGGGKIIFETTGMNRETILSLFQKIESACMVAQGLFAHGKD